MLLFPRLSVAGRKQMGLHDICNRKRHRGDSNPCGQSPMDFESISLTARTQCLVCDRHTDHIRTAHTRSAWPLRNDETHTPRTLNILFYLNAVLRHGQPCMQLREFANSIFLSLIVLSARILVYLSCFCLRSGESLPPPLRFAWIPRGYSFFPC